MDAAAGRIERAGAEAGEVTRLVLAALPEWFARPAAVEGYVAAAARLPTFVASAPSGAPLGFVTFEHHSPVTAEVHVMGVVPGAHRAGLGRRLLATAERHLIADGVRWLTIKTLAPTHPDPHYARTRCFYEACGFEPLEVFATLWDADTPGLMMIKALSRQHTAPESPADG